MTKIITLTQGKEAIVDDVDFDELSKYKWYYDTYGYAGRTISRKLGKKNIKMHRVIMKTPTGMETDHLDGNPLNNQRNNLRICTHSENIKNQKRRADNTSGYRGVSFRSDTGKWGACIWNNNQHYSLGAFENPIDAALAYDEAAKKYHGEFARLNFPEADK